MSFAHLDYPSEQLAPFGRRELVMEANTDIEQSMRVVACSKEPWTVALIESMQPGEVLWDIGANVGPYTLLAAARGLGVVAFEAMPENHATLVRNLARNQLLDSVIALPIALGDSDGTIWLHYGDMRSGAASHTISPAPRKISLHKQLIPILTAQTAVQVFSLPIPHAIKLDVDGGEQMVLAGAEFVLAHAELRALLIELQRNPQGQAITIWLAERGWQIAEAYEPRGPIQYALFKRAGADATAKADWAEAPALPLNRSERRRRRAARQRA